MGQTEALVTWSYEQKCYLFLTGTNAVTVSGFLVVDEDLGL
jgi:hypothetical protein